MKFYRNHKIQYSKLAIIIILTVIIWRNFNLSDWNRPNKVILWDVVSYYSYLPATFIHHDIELDFLDKGKEYHKGIYWPKKTPNGNRIIMTSMGMSFMYMPFFLLAHGYTLITSPENAYGFSSTYKFFLVMSSVFYLATGLIFLRKVLKRYFNDQVVSIVLLTTTLATNLYCYTTTEPTMSHAYSFSLISIFLYLVIKWYQGPKLLIAALLGLVGGLIVLIRPTNILIITVYLFWGVTDYRSFKNRIFFLWKKKYAVFITIFVAFLIWLPQLSYWKHITDQWFYYSYGSDERFFFNNPRIIKVLFSYRKGWFVYTPLMFVSICGLFLLRKYVKGAFIPVFIFVVLNIYVISSWWSWWYGGSFGLRAFIDSYAIMAIPLGAITTYFLSQKKFIRIGYLVFLFLFLSLNIFNTMQYRYGSIHWDSMSKEAYWKSFLKLKQPENFEWYLEPLDYNAARKGKYKLEKKEKD